MPLPTEIPTLLSRGISILFLLLLLNFSKMILVRSRVSETLGGSLFPGYIKVIHALGWLCFIAIFIAQSYHQLAGFIDPDFISAAKLYDKRVPNYALTLQRGSVVDRQGTVLATATKEGGAQRHYPYGSITSHFIGYDHPKFGKTGLEGARDSFLMGRTMGSKTEFLTVLNNLFFHSRLKGNDLTVTLDIRLQREAATLLTNTRGAVIVMDPHTGDILTWVSAPSYDPNSLTDSLFTTVDQAARLLDRVCSGYYPPGSCFKIVLASASLQVGAKEFFCRGSGYTPVVEERPINDHEYYEALEKKQTWKGHGKLTLEQAFTVSCNVYFAQLGVSLGYERIYQELQAFGLLSPIPILPLAHRDTGITGPSSKLPLPPEVELLDLTNIAIGQGSLLLTPLQVALMTTAIANDGYLMYPRVTMQTPLSSKAVGGDPTRWQKLRKMMAQVVDSGTGKAAQSAKVKIAGKTGTAENPFGQGHAWFAGFAPVTDPKLVFVVLIENSGYASSTAVPLTRKLMEKAAELGYFQAVVSDSAATTGQR